MKVVNEEVQNNIAVERPVANGMMRVYNKIDGSTVDVHAVDAREYVNRLPHLWSFEPISREQAKAEDAEIVAEPEKEVIVENKPVESEAPAMPEDKPISARSRKIAKLD